MTQHTIGLVQQRIKALRERIGLEHTVILNIIRDEFNKHHSELTLEEWEQIEIVLAGAFLETDECDEYLGKIDFHWLQNSQRPEANLQRPSHSSQRPCHTQSGFHSAPLNSDYIKSYLLTVTEKEDCKTINQTLNITAQKQSKIAKSLGLAPTTREKVAGANVRYRHATEGTIGYSAKMVIDCLGYNSAFCSFCDRFIDLRNFLIYCQQHQLIDIDDPAKDFGDERFNYHLANRLNIEFQGALNLYRNAALGIEPFDELTAKKNPTTEIKSWEHQPTTKQIACGLNSNCIQV